VAEENVLLPVAMDPSGDARDLLAAQSDLVVVDAVPRVVPGDRVVATV
jgi:hypothetical protein